MASCDERALRGLCFFCDSALDERDELLCAFHSASISNPARVDAVRLKAGRRIRKARSRARKNNDPASHTV